MSKDIAEKYDQKDGLSRQGGRTFPFYPAGGVGAFVHEGKIININMTNWTVDFVTQFDYKFYLGVQVSSPYLHSNTGEGFSAFPEVGAKCLLCIPSDGPPPFILAYIMPMETIGDTSSEESPAGTASNGGDIPSTTAATFSGGRSKAKPGDITVRGRDGNFVTLHRGGVLQIGATELAQRIYIPLDNLITDISENYHHHNTAGSINWGIQQGAATSDHATYHKQTYRLFAEDQKATIRVLSSGNNDDYLGEPTGDAGQTSNLNQLNIGIPKVSPIVYEVVVSPEHFDAESGDPDDKAKESSVLRFFFDKQGGAFLRSESSVLLAIEKKLKVTVKGDILLETKGSFSLTAAGRMSINGSTGVAIDSNGKVVFKGGKQPIGRVGDTVIVPIPAATLTVTNLSAIAGTVSGAVCTIPPGALLAALTQVVPVNINAIISTGNPDILA